MSAGVQLVYGIPEVSTKEVLSQFKSHVIFQGQNDIKINTLSQVHSPLPRQCSPWAYRCHPSGV